MAPLAAGGPDAVFHRPRWSPDGRWIVAALQTGGRWRLVRVDPASGARRFIDPDDGASRYDAAFLPGGGRIVAVSERGGVANLEILDPASGAVRPLTRVTGAAVAPAPSPATGAVYFLGLHARGHDLRRIHPDSAAPADVVPLPAGLAPAAPLPPAAPADTFARAPLPPARPYGAGPRSHRVLPLASLSADGATAGALLLGGDPVGRLTWMAQGALGERGAWRGGSLRAAWRGWRPALGAEAFALRQGTPRCGGAGACGDPPGADYRGGALWAERAWTGGAARHGVRAGASLGRLDLAGDDGDVSRALGWAEYALSRSAGAGGRRLGASLALLASAGRTGGEGWGRLLATLAAGGRLGPVGVRGEAAYGVAAARAGSWERFAAGGAPPALLDPTLLSQRLPVPGLPTGAVAGRRVLALRGSLANRFLPTSPYLWAGRSMEAGDGWHRVVGAERTLPFAATPYLNLPETRVLLGMSHSLDEPFRDRTRVYASVVYRP